MFRISTATSAANLFGAGKNGFRDGNLGSGILPTDFNAEFCNAIQEELMGIVETSGQVGGAGTYNHVMKGLKRLYGGNVRVITAAGPTALTVDDAGLVLIDATANAVAVTLPAVNAITAVPLLFEFVRIDSVTANAVTVSRAGADTFVGGGTSFALSSQNDFRSVMGDATSKWVTTSQAVSSSVMQLMPVATPTLAGNAMTVPAVQFTLGFRKPNLATGGVDIVTGTPAALTIPAGATLGSLSGKQSSIIDIVMNNGGTLERAVVNLAGGVDLSMTGLISTTAISAGATAANVVYSNTARSNLPYWVVGRYDSTQAVAGQWATQPTLVQGNGGQAGMSMRTFSRLRLNTYNGYGSTNTKIPRFTNVVEYVPGDFTYADSATLGASITIVNPGMYMWSHNANLASAVQMVGASLNSSQLATAISAINAADILAVGETNVANSTGGIGGCPVWLNPGDVVRPHTDGGAAGATPTTSQFSFARVG